MNPTEKCRIPECNDPEKATGLCNRHYKKQLKYGDPLGTGRLAPRGLTRDELFLRKVDKVSSPDGCWLWTGKINKRGKGYGDFTYRADDYPVTVAAHRYAYALWVGLIPDGMTIDHVWDNGCRNTHCVRPEHLEPVTPAEQNRRYYSRQTHCKYGHEFTAENTIMGGPNGRTRHCRECGRRRTREHWARTYVPTPAPLKTHCKNGHEFTPENTKMGGRGGNTRLCIQCLRAAQVRFQAKHRGATSSPS